MLRVNPFRQGLTHKIMKQQIEEIFESSEEVRAADFYHGMLSPH